MPALTATTWVFALLLILAGARKVSDPSAAGAALQVAQLPSDARLVRLLGVGEVVLGIAVLAVGGPVPAATLAAAYAAFAVFAYRQSRIGAGCGCFGEANAPASGLHVTVDAAGAAVAVAAAVWPAPSLLATLPGDTLRGVLTLALLAVAAGVLRLTLTALPELAAAAALDAPANVSGADR